MAAWSAPILAWGWLHLKRFWVAHDRDRSEMAGPSYFGLETELDDLDVLPSKNAHASKSRPQEPPVEPLLPSPWERISVQPRGNGKISASDTLSKAGDEVPVADEKKPEQRPESTPPKPSPWQSLETVERPVTSRVMQQAIEEYLHDQLSPTDSEEARPSKQQAGESDPKPAGPIRVTRRADEEIPRAATKGKNCPTDDDFVLPPVDLLDKPAISGRTIDEKLLERNATVLEQKLADLGVRGKVVEIHPGPVITMYELSLASGIPLRKVLSTSDDLAMALKCGSTRVVAPIPGKGTVGIEVPNLNREIVYFREIIESPAFMESNAPLKVALGKGIDGEPFATSLTKMPHLLIAGATGTGKSVGLNCLICSWLMSCTPDEVKFLMVDPKKLELSYYQDIPHLIHPVVTEPEKVPKVLSWAIREMERRYDLLSKAGAKNIEGYNALNTLRPTGPRSGSASD